MSRPPAAPALCFRRPRVFAVAVLFVLLAAGPASAQFYFGKNKVQYTDFDWLVLTTTHFNIYFYESERAVAEVAAESAERSYDILADRFNHQVPRRVPLIIYSSPNFFTETNVVSNLLPENVGGFTEFLKGRVVMPFNGSYADFRRVLQHELVHVFTISKLSAVNRAHRRKKSPSPPLWFTEGLAEFYSGQWDSRGDMILSDLVLNGRLNNLAGLQRFSGTYIMYKAGESFFHFIEEVYGTEYILRIFENWWRGKSFEDVIAATFGKSLNEIGVEWGYWLKKRYYPTIRSRELTDRVAHAVTRSGYNVKPVPLRLTVNGQTEDWIAFKGNRLGYAGLYMIRTTPNGRRIETLLRGERSPAFESLHLLGSGIDASADGRIVFSSKNHERDVLYILDATQRRVIAEYRFDSLYVIASPKFSPDGRRIVFSGCGKDGIHDLFLYDLTTASLRRLTHDLYLDSDPVFTPDGRSIVFSSDRGPYGDEGYMNLFRLRLDDDRQEEMATGTRTGGGILDQVPGETAASVASTQSAPPVSWRAPSEDAVVAIPGGSRIEAMTHGRHNDRAPSFSPLSDDIVFSSDRNGRYDIYRLTPRGRIDQLTRVATGAFDPRFLPDGDSFVFTSYQNLSFQIFKMPLPDPDSLLVVVPADTVVSTGVAMSDSSVVTAWTPLRSPGETTRGAVKYHNRFSFDIAQSAVSFDAFYGTLGGFQTALSDVLGNKQYYFLVANNASASNELLSSFSVAVNYINRQHRLNYGYGAFHLYNSYIDPVDGALGERQYGLAGYLGYPLSKFRRVEASLFLRQSDRRIFFGGRERNAVLATQFFGFVQDNSLWDVSGPIDGHRVMLSVGYTFNLSRMSYFNRLAVIDARKYFRLGRYSAFATRILGHFSSGHEPQRRYLGGSWDLRGYPRWGEYARNILLLSNELRFPLIDALFVGFPVASLGFQAIRGAVFFDAGNAWEDDFGRMKGSLGVGARVSLGYLVLLRFDWARRTDFRTIDDKTRFEFFFGWNF